MTRFFIILSIIAFSCKTYAQAISISYSKQHLCKRNVEKISFESAGTFGANNYFTVQLSDSLGVFSNPLSLCRFKDTTFSEIAFVVPDTLLLGGQYRIRVVSSNPEIVSADNGANLSIIDSCGSVADSAIILKPLASSLICTPDSITVKWHFRDSTFSNTNTFTIQLSDSSGVFVNPLNLAVVASTDSVKKIFLENGLLEGTKYRIRIIATDSSAISRDNGEDIAIRTKPRPKISFIPTAPCMGDLVKIIASDSLNGVSYLWSGLGTGTNDTLIISNAGLSNAGNYSVLVSKNGCSVSTSKALILSNCKPDWSWALADTFWTNTFKYPSTIVDTELDSDNNLVVAGFFSEQMVLGNTTINTILGNNAFCDSTEKRTGFLARISASGQLLWYRKWNSLAEIGDYQYCDVTIDNNQIYLVSEYNAYAPCSSAPRNQASLVITDEEDFALGSLLGFCRYPIPNTNPTQYRYRYKGRFIWAAKFDLSGNLDAFSNLTEMKTCGSSPANFDSQPTLTLGNKGYYSLKSRNGKLWLLYTWNQGLLHTIKFTNGNQYTNEAAGLVIAELNTSNLSILKFEKVNITTTNGILGLSNLEIDPQNNLIVSGSSGTVAMNTAQQIVFRNNQLSFNNADYFVAKYNTTLSNWDWAKKSNIELVNTYSGAAPSIKTDTQNNIYLAFDYKPLAGGDFAGLSLPATPKDFDSNQAVALFKINSSGIAQWVMLNNHRLQNGRNTLAVDLENNIYVASYLRSTPQTENFLIANHRLPNPELKTYTNSSGTPMIAIYKPSGLLAGTISNIKVEKAIALNGLVVDSYKNVVLSGHNVGKTSFGQLRIQTNFGNTADTLDDRKRGFITKIANPQSIVLDTVSIHVCSGTQGQVRFKTNGGFINNQQFKIQLIGKNGVYQGKVLDLTTTSNDNYTFLAPDSLGENTFYPRISTIDNTIFGTYRVDDTLVINTTPKPVILSNQLGYSLDQKMCSNKLTNYRIQGWGGTQGVLKYNGNTVYVGSNIDYQPTPQQSGIYTIHWTQNGCTGVSPELVLNIYNPLSVQLIGNQTISRVGSPVYLSLFVNGGKEYNASISGIPSFVSDKSFQSLQVIPTESSVYKIDSIYNVCGKATVTTGTANVTVCLNSLNLKNPDDNYSRLTILKQTNQRFGNIEANNRILDKSNVIYNSGKKILLTPGFETADSVVFSAKIGGCKAIAPVTAPDFKLGYQKLFINNGNADQTILEMTEFADKGANLFEMTLRLEEVYKSLSQFNETNPDSLNKYWALYDKIINHASNIYDHVVFRIAVDYDDSRYYFQDRDETRPNQQVYTTFNNALFDLFSEIAQDQFGNPARIAYGSGHGSFASTTAKAKMKGFVQKALDRYYPVLQEKLYWVSVVTSAQFETGFNYENSWNGFSFVPSKPCEYDYTPANVSQFRNWLVTEKYPNLAAVNAAHNTNYTNPDQIQPPKVNVSILDNMTNSNVRAMYNSALFEDWYKFNYKQLKSFLIECKNAVKAKNNNIKFCFESGSNTDQLSVARKTLNVPDISTYADVLKTAFTNTEFNGTKTWDADIIRSNFTGEIQSEINESDVVNQGGITDPNTVKQKMLEYSRSAFLNKAGAVIFVADRNTQYYNNSLNALSEFKNWIDNHTEQFSQGQTININLSDLIRNFPSAKTPFEVIAPSLPANGYQNRPKIIINQ